MQWTDKKKKLLLLLANGDSFKEIGPKLGITAETARGASKHIYSVLGARNKTHAVSLALRAGIITVQEIFEVKP